MFHHKNIPQHNSMQRQALQSNSQMLSNIQNQKIIQRNIIFLNASNRFSTNRDRIAIDSMETATGSDRSHTVSDREVQQMVADFLNELYRNLSSDANRFIDVCIHIAGEDESGAITSLISAILENKTDPQKLVELGNTLYATVANSRYNLRLGDPSGNRSTGQHLDLNGPEIIGFDHDGAIIYIRITAVDANTIISLLRTSTPATILVKEEKRLGAIASSTDPKFSGHGKTYEITYIEPSEDDSFYIAHASLL